MYLHSRQSNILLRNLLSEGRVTPAARTTAEGRPLALLSLRYYLSSASESCLKFMLLFRHLTLNDYCEYTEDWTTQINLGQL